MLKEKRKKDWSSEDWNQERDKDKRKYILWRKNDQVGVDSS